MTENHGYGPGSRASAQRGSARSAARRRATAPAPDAPGGPLTLAEGMAIVDEAQAAIRAAWACYENGVLTREGYDEFVTSVDEHVKRQLHGEEP